MSFNPSIPQLNDPISLSQRQINANFQAINTVFSQNHVSLRNSANPGMHTVLDFVTQPDPTTSSNQVSLYNKLVSNIPALFFRPSSSGTPIQMTYPSVQTGLQTVEPPAYFPQQYSFVAGPFVVYGGFLKGVAKGDLVTLMPSTTLLYVGVVNASGINSPLISSTAIAKNISGNSFNVDFQTQGAGVTINVYYLAIGKL